MFLRTQMKQWYIVLFEAGTCAIAKFTDEQYTTINQSTAGRFDPRVFVNCLQVSKQLTKQLTKTLGSKRPAVD